MSAPGPCFNRSTPRGQCTAPTMLGPETITAAWMNRMECHQCRDETHSPRHCSLQPPLRREMLSPSIKQHTRSTRRMSRAFKGPGDQTKGPSERLRRKSTTVHDPLPYPTHTAPPKYGAILNGSPPNLAVWRQLRNLGAVPPGGQPGTLLARRHLRPDRPGRRQHRLWGRPASSAR